MGKHVKREIVSGEGLGYEWVSDWDLSKLELITNDRDEYNRPLPDAIWMLIASRDAGEGRIDEYEIWKGKGWKQGYKMAKEWLDNHNISCFYSDDEIVEYYEDMKTEEFSEEDLEIIKQLKRRLKRR
jgi:hypothetical protein